MNIFLIFISKYDSTFGYFMFWFCMIKIYALHGSVYSLSADLSRLLILNYFVCVKQMRNKFYINIY